MTPTMELFRNAISEGSDTGMLVAADGLDESGNPQDATLAELLRKYVEMQTMVRMSIVPPTAFAKRYLELQAEFKTKAEKAATGYGVYSKPLGPFYTALRIDQTALANDLNQLSTEPVRELEITYCRPQDADFAVILRNYRMESMFSLKISFGYRQNNPAAHRALCEAIKGLNAPMLQRLTVTGIEDRQKHVQLFFGMARKLPKGCELHYNQNYYGDAKLVTTKK